MSSLKKRATWGMVLTAVFLVSGVTLLCFGNGSVDHALQSGFANIEKNDGDDFVKGLFFGSLPAVAGIGLTVLGLVLFPLFLYVWICNPPAGSKLTLRGWKKSEEMTETDLARDEAWKAILWGQTATQSWIIQLFLGGFRSSRSLHSAPPFLTKLLLLLVVMCIVFYALGIRLCRQRKPESVAAAPLTWKFALIVNYGGLFGFLVFAGVLFFLLHRA